MDSTEPVISICNNTIFNTMIVKNKGRDFELILYELNYSLCINHSEYVLVTKEEERRS